VGNKEGNKVLVQLLGGGGVEGLGEGGGRWEAEIKVRF
jgi:hypothetical protein